MSPDGMVYVGPTSNGAFVSLGLDRVRRRQDSPFDRTSMVPGSCPPPGPRLRGPDPLPSATVRRSPTSDDPCLCVSQTPVLGLWVRVGLGGLGLTCGDVLQT